MKYQLIVGNIGTVLDTDNGFKANTEYQRYVGQSMATHGRASREEVTLMVDGEPHRHYFPPPHRRKEH